MNINGRSRRGGMMGALMRGGSPLSPLWGAAALAAVAAVLAGVVVAVSWKRAAPSRPAGLVGIVVEPPIPADSFRLRDPEGRTVSIEDFRGRPVVLTFLYTHCPDVCPLIAERLRTTSSRLNADRARAAFVAVSVDPRGDTPDAVRAFLAGHHLEHVLVYLTGSAGDLQRVWTQYHVRTEVETIGEETGPAVAASRKRTGAQPTFVGHTARVYVIDARGAIRAYLPGDFRPADLAADVRLLSADHQRGAP